MNWTFSLVDNTLSSISVRNLVGSKLNKSGGQRDKTGRYEQRDPCNTIGGKRGRCLKI